MHCVCDALTDGLLMAITVQALAQLPLFAGLGDDALQEIMPYLHERTFPIGLSSPRSGLPSAEPVAFSHWQRGGQSNDG